jgi:hypothetical protein
LSPCGRYRARLASSIDNYHKLGLDSLPPLLAAFEGACVARFEEEYDRAGPGVHFGCGLQSFPPPPPSDDDGYLPAREDELENSLLASTFTFALRSMSNLVKLTLHQLRAISPRSGSPFVLGSVTFVRSNIFGERTCSNGSIARSRSWTLGSRGWAVLLSVRFSKIYLMPPIHQHQPRNIVQFLLLMF